jgi:hypothetical protein
MPHTRISVGGVKVIDADFPEGHVVVVNGTGFAAGADVDLPGTAYPVPTGSSTEPRPNELESG